MVKNVSKGFRLLLAALVVGAGLPALAQESAKPELKLSPVDTTVKPSGRPVQSRPEILLVMPNAKADVDETFDAIKEVHGTIIGRFGDGAMTTLIIQTESGKLADTEQKLRKDEHFSNVQRDYMAVPEVTGSSTSTPNDPYFPSQWHVGALNAAAAWSQSRGAGVVIAIADTGSQATNPDLRGKTYTGCDVVRDTQSGNVDNHSSSHGTLCATAAAATTNNATLAASPAQSSNIFPIIISSGGQTSDLYVAKAIYEAGRRGYRIINISYGPSDARYSFANPQVHPVVHQYLRWFHDQCNGLAFFAAGNSRQFDPHQRLPYLIMVSALDRNYRLASFSNYGNCIWFTAPGSGIVCSDRQGRVASVNGTSFASPLAASVAAMVMSRNPGLRNTQIEQIMIATCRNAAGSTWNQQFGYGLPDAAAAVARAR